MMATVDGRGLDTSRIRRDYESAGFIRCWSVYVPPEAGEEVSKTLATGWVNTGKKEREFRDRLCIQFGARHAVACNSGTSALKAAMQALGVRPGDEVVSTPFTFIATNTSILEMGAVPVFADIDYATLNVTAETIAKRITERTKAIMVVHYGGLPCEMDEIRGLAASRGLPVIEDSAHAMGSFYKGRPIGSEGDAVTFSFQAVKIVNCADGGAICTADPLVYGRLKEAVWYGIDRENKRADPLDPLPADIKELGFKANMNDVTATLACVAMDHLPEQMLVRRRIGEFYREELDRVGCLKMVEYPEHSSPNYQIFPVHVEDRDRFAQFMFSRGIQVNVNNRRNDCYTLFGGLREDLPNTARADADVILLPCHADLSSEDLARVVRTVQEFDRTVAGRTPDQVWVA